MLTRTIYREQMDPVVSRCDFILSSRRDIKENGRFVFQSYVSDQVWTYLTTDLVKKESIEEWQNNFSSFYVLRKSDWNILGIIWFSIRWISLFSEGYKNRKDMPKNPWSFEYRKLEEIEKISEKEDLFHLKNYISSIRYGMKTRIHNLFTI